ncbi:aldose epimerase family protein [Fredinandcohnia quinoae]|uniref:Aldose 1-epimerase n=1 Tax=Fredinandcohnia quinoae TaxID=2918902 RepID=A0AAW5DY68_9BACI|nr:aldose epimerase family protein [Fredinandcohnia sp. SECRCQ15]MCH1625033.1 galactose mutarotase [Fredinandcohnia sp. SECRCQ15]
MEVISQSFDRLGQEEIQQYTITNDHGMSVSCINYGCIITDIVTPDRDGKLENVVLGFDNVGDYIEHAPYFGAMIGRVAGRIKGAQFELDGHVYSLDKNEKDNHLHGGKRTFHNVLWDATVIEDDEKSGVEFTYVSKDGEEGYPGNLNMTVTYVLNNDNELTITATGFTDQTTLLNVTNHTYFNLSGGLRRDILQHELTMKSDQFVQLNEELLPTGRFLDVSDTPFDFRTARKIVDGTVSTDEQNILAGHGYDHPFLLNSNHDQEIQLYDEESGRHLIVESNQPSVVVYTSNQINGGFKIGEVEARDYLGICLETQGLPDAIHHPQFPPIVLKKGEQYNWTTTYKFAVVK